VAEPTVKAFPGRLVESLLPRVPKGRVAEVVPERDRLGEVLVQAQGPCHRARDAGRLERVREARAVMIALGVDEDLGLVLQAAEGLAVDDPVAVALKRRPQAAFLLFRVRAAPGLVRAHRERGEPALLVLADTGLEGVRHPPCEIGHASYAIAR
jgi:hypothetical protein